MPLRDQFRPPLATRRHWEGFHGQWTGMIVMALTRRLPRRYAAEPRIQWGASVEIDVATYEEDAPDLFARLKARVAEGRWEPIGGSWLEPDCMVTGGEAFVRHLLYGQRYFERAFGKRSTVAWLPDVFGFSAGIPQLLRGAGIDGFSPPS